MKTVTKILLVAAALLVLAGALLFTAVMAKNNWNFAALSTDDYVTNSYPVPKDIQSISIRTDTENIVFLPSDAKGCRVEITEKKEEPHWVAVEDGTLRIEEPEKEDWSFSLSLPLAEPKIAVYLPKGEYADLFIEESTGKIDIPEAFQTTVNISSEPEMPRRSDKTQRSEKNVRDFPCRDRAAAMGALSSLMLEMGAEFSDGIRFPLGKGSVHIFPRAETSALAVAVDAPDAEFAASLALSAGEIIIALDL